MARSTNLDLCRIVTRFKMLKDTPTTIEEQLLIPIPRTRGLCFTTSVTLPTVLLAVVHERTRIACRSAQYDWLISHESMLTSRASTKELKVRTYILADQEYCMLQTCGNNNLVLRHITNPIVMFGYHSLPPRATCVVPMGPWFCSFRGSGVE